MIMKMLKIYQNKMKKNRNISHFNLKLKWVFFIIFLKIVYKNKKKKNFYF